MLNDRSSVTLVTVCPTGLEIIGKRFLLFLNFMYIHTFYFATSLLALLFEHYIVLYSKSCTTTDPDGRCIVQRLKGS